MTALIEVLEPTMKEHAADMVRKLRDVGIEDVVDFGMLDDGDLATLADGEALVAAKLCRDVAKRTSVGWAKGIARKHDLAPKARPKALPVPAKPNLKKSSAALTAFTRKVVLGQRAARREAAEVHTTLESREAELMRLAKEAVHKVFVQYASDSPRLCQLQGATPRLRDMQLDVYRMGSRAHKVVKNRANLALSFFLDMAAFGWDYKNLTPFEVAAWTRGRVQGASKSAASCAKQTLALIETSTDVVLHAAHPVVKGQLCAKANDGVTEDESKEAKNIEVNVIIQFEELVYDAPTVQIQCMAGFFALLASSSLRASDALRTRGLRLTPDAITGASRMKTKKSWTRWYADRRGFSGKEWVTEWLGALERCGLPGPDYLISAPVSSLDGWLKRPAAYGDVRRALHLMLITFVGMSPQQAAEYNPHGFRHVLVTAGQQMCALGRALEEDLERLGHWAKNSSMPRKYDSTAGVTELSARVSIMQAFRSGWRPVGAGCMPSRTGLPPQGSSSSGGTPLANVVSPGNRGCDNPPGPDYIMVGHKKRRRVHFVKSANFMTKCNVWNCGTETAPTEHASFSAEVQNWRLCRNCGR